MKCSEEYKEKLAAFVAILKNTNAISRKFGGIKYPTYKHFFASILHTTLVNKSTGFAFLLPHNPWCTTSIDYWDSGTTSLIARAIFETRLCFHYLCIDICSDDEWNCRIGVFNLHDCTRRIQLVDNESKRFRIQAEKIKEELFANDHFNSLPQKQQNKLLKTETQYLYPLADIAKKTGIKESEFKIIYPLLSAHVHCLPFSFYRTGEENRGIGVHSPVEEGYLTIHMNIVSSMLEESSMEYSSMWE